MILKLLPSSIPLYSTYYSYDDDLKLLLLLLGLSFRCDRWPQLTTEHWCFTCSIWIVFLDHPIFSCCPYHTDIRLPKFVALLLRSLFLGQFSSFIIDDSWSPFFNLVTITETKPYSFSFLNLWNFVAALNRLSVAHLRCFAYTITNYGTNKFVTMSITGQLRITRLILLTFLVQKPLIFFKAERFTL